MLSDVRGWGTCNLYFFIKENLIFAVTRHHAEPNINILLTRNLPFDSDVRRWSHPLVIPFNAYNRTNGQFECGVTWFCFRLNSFTFTVRLLFIVCVPYQSTTINIDGSAIKSSNSQKYVQVTIDSNFIFEKHINSLCWKSSQKTTCIVQNITIFIYHQMRGVFCSKRL